MSICFGCGGERRAAQTSTNQHKRMAHSDFQYLFGGEEHVASSPLTLKMFFSNISEGKTAQTMKIPTQTSTNVAQTNSCVKISKFNRWGTRDMELFIKLSVVQKSL